MDAVDRQGDLMVSDLPRVLIFGIGGLLGYRLAKLMQYSDWNFYGTYNLRNPLLDQSRTYHVDITNDIHVKDIIKRVNPHIIINCCSLTSVDYCESHENEARAINVDFVARLADYCTDKNIKLIHISSDSVFDGKKDTPYTEEDIPNPINIYGKTKLASERIVLSNSRNVVVRASVLYGVLPHYVAKMESSSKKALNFGQWLVYQLQSRKSVTIVRDEISSPIIADDFAKAIIHIIDKNISGLLHLAPDTVINRYEFSLLLARALSLDEKLIISVSNKELGRKVVTGFNKSLNAKKFELTASYDFMSLEKSLSLLARQCYNP